MIVSWEWLREYVVLDVSPEDFLDRLTMAGLNIDTKHRWATTGPSTSR